MKMIFDMTSPELAVSSLAELTHVSRNEILLFLNTNIVREDSYINGRRVTYENFCDMVGQSFDEVSLHDTKVVALHFSSNDDNCYSLKTNGLRDLQYVLENETPFSKFLAEKGLRFNVQKKTMSFNGKDYDITYNPRSSRYESPVNSIAHKIYYDYSTSAFVYVKDVTSYLGNVHLRPEFLYNLQSFDHRLKDLSREWVSRCKCYEVKFSAPINTMDDCMFENRSTIKWLVESALLIAGDMTDEQFFYVKRGCHIEAENILNITEKIY
jgi:hypothetical protein